MLLLQKTRAKSSSLDFPCPTNFLAHIEAARLEKDRREGLIQIHDDSSMKIFSPLSDPLSSHHYNVFCCDMKDFAANIPRCGYKLAIADIPYGFKLKGSVNDVALGHKQIDAMISAFKAFNTAPNWSFIIFHSTTQAASVAKAFMDHCHSWENMIW